MYVDCTSNLDKSSSDTFGDGSHPSLHGPLVVEGVEPRSLIVQLANVILGTVGSQLEICEVREGKGW